MNMIPKECTEQFHLFLNGYLVALVWLTIVEDLEGNDVEIDSFGEHTCSHLMARLRDDMRVTAPVALFFLREYERLSGLIESGECAGWDQHGHDLFLSREGHGECFLTRGYGGVGDELDSAANELGGCGLEFWVVADHPMNDYAFVFVDYSVLDVSV